MTFNKVRFVVNTAQDIVFTYGDFEVKEGQHSTDFHYKVSPFGTDEKFHLFAVAELQLELSKYFINEFLL